jgi:hypothetical protein
MSLPASSFPTVTGNQTTTLAWFASMAYQNTWTTADSLGWHLVSGSELGLSDSTLSNGHYVNSNASALVASADFNGSNVLMISFRGSDDNSDWVTNLTDINRHFELFNSLSNAAESALHSGTYDAILVTGHSLGGAMTECYLSTYSDPNVFGISWGSPGIIDSTPTADNRLINYVFTDDGVAWLGSQRTEIADSVSLTSLGAFATVLDGLGVGKTVSLAVALNNLDTNYQHDGTTAIIDTSGDYIGYYDPSISFSRFNNYISTHDKGRYVAASVNLNPNPFSLPDSTVQGTMLSSSEADVMKLYDTVYNTEPNQPVFHNYSVLLGNGGDAKAAAIGMLNGSGLRLESKNDLVTTLYENVYGRDPTSTERSWFQTYGRAYSAAELVVGFASSAEEASAMASTVNLAGALGTYG